ncbi:MAG: DMT family transporter [Pseudomonadota bacterium]
MVSKKYLVSSLSPYQLGLFLAITAAVLFGIVPCAVRAVYADGGNAIFMMIVSIWARALGLLGYCIVMNKPMFQTREDCQQAVVGGVMQAFSSCGVMTALIFMPATLVIMVLMTHSLMLLFFLVWKGEVKLDAMTLITIIAALLGLSLVLDIWHKQPIENLWGIGIAFAAACAIVVRMYVYGKQTLERNPAVVGAENFLVAAIITLLVLVFKAPHLPNSITSYAWVALGCIATALATFMMFYGISLLGSFTWSLYSKLEPIFTALFSAWFIHEILKPHQYGGMLIVVTSLVVYQTMKTSVKVSIR